MKTEIEIPEGLATKFDNAIIGYYTNRNEAIRHSIRLLIDRLKKRKGSEKNRKSFGAEVYRWGP